MAAIDVSAQKLHELLAEHAESPALEYIGDSDLGSRRDIVELATEVAALAAQGGWIVVGVDNSGVPTGWLDDRKLRLFDDSTLRDKMGRYLPSIELRASQHEIDSRAVVLIGVEAHPDGAVVFAADGTYEESGARQTAFHRGDLFVRHGSKTERPEQVDITRIVSRAVDRARLWQDEVPRIEQAILDLREAAASELDRYPDDQITGVGRSTNVPALRRRLVSRLRAFERFGGPELSECWDLAEGHPIDRYTGILARVFGAMDEVARVASF